MRRLIVILLLVVIPAWPAAAQIDVTVDKFGVGNAFRPGDFAGVRVLLTSSDPEPTPVWVQIEVPNGDGDIGEYGRSITLTSGQQLPVWLYIPVPIEIEPTSVYAIRVFEERDGRRRRELGGARFSPGTAGAVRVPELMSMLAVVGPGQVNMRLADYSSPNGGTQRPAFAHEDTWVRFGLRPADLPDRWEGLKAFEAIAWGGDQYAPQQLSQRQADALRDYVQRGGHLVVSLPEAGGSWGLGSQAGGPLDELLPPQEPRRDVGVPVVKLLSATSKVQDPRQLASTSVAVTLRVFQELGGDFDRVSAPWNPLIALDDGRVIAIQRTFGFGHVTVVGLDLTDRRFTNASLRALQADIFWNRILGRRLDTPTAAEIDGLVKNDMIVTGTIPENHLGGGQLFSQLISMSEQAGRGLLLTFLLFIAYLVVIGPIGFWGLKQYRVEKHAWVIFAATAGVFTVAAWGLVSLVKPSTYRVRHLTYLDMIGRPDGDRPGDPQLQRAVSWFSLNMPGYAPVGVFLDSEPDQRNLLASWSPPGVLTQPFPNPDRFRVDVGANYADIEILDGPRGDDPTLKRPSRATATQLYANWMGGVSADWGGVMRADPLDPVRVELEANDTEVLRGSVVHELPGELRDVIIIWVKSRRLTNRSYARTNEGPLPWIAPARSGSMLNAGGMWAKARWSPGEPLDLVKETKQTSLIQRDIFERYVKEYTRSAVGIAGGTGPTTAADRTRYLDMYSFFNQLEPPQYIADRAGSTSAQTVSFYRLLGRELDLSSWFSSPCLIVIGRLEGATSPIPLLVNGEPPEVDENSLTIARWITPLKLEERVAFSNVFREDDAE